MAPSIKTAAMVILAAVVLPAAAHARGTKQPGDGVPESIRYYETVAMMSPSQVASEQPAGGGAGVKTAEVSFFTLGRQFDLKLEEHNPFAEGATVHWIDDTGEVAEPAVADGTFYSGRVDGDPHSWVRLAMRGNTLAGVVATDDELYFLEPASRFFGEEVANETLAYRMSDTDSEWEPGSCGAIDPPTHNQHRLGPATSMHSAMHEVLGAAVAAAASGSLKRAQIGMVADYLYFSKHGANSASDIAEIINNVDGIYQAEVGVTIQILSSVVFTTQGSDPFFSTGVDANTLLTTFQNWRSANDTNSSQPMWNTDIAHLITGRDVNGACPQSGGCPNNCCVIGLSYIDALCDSTYGVGIDQDFTTAVNLLTLLLAHEMGHNFGAYHDAQANSACPCCAGSPGTFIMNPVLLSSLQQKFSDCTKSFINPAVSAASCFDTVTIQPPGPPTLDPITSPIVLGTTVALTGSGFTAGSQIIGFVGTSAGTQSLGPFVPSSWTSTRLTWAVPANMSLGQGFAILAVVNTDQNYVGSQYEQVLLYGNASLNRPTLLGINGGSLHQPDGALPVVYVATPVYPGSVVTLTGTGFNNSGINFFTSAGNLGPLWPVAGATSTQLQVQIPADAPLGLGAFEVINNPYSGFVGSQTVFVPIGDPPTITHVSQSGSTITVTGTGFANGAVVNFFDKQSNGAVLNLGGPGMGASVDSTVQLHFAVPSGAVPGPAYVQIVNPPFITLTSTGNDPDGSFTLQ